MDSTPSTSASSVSPPKKRVRLGLGLLSVSEKQTIINMYKKNKFDVPERRTTHIVSEIMNTIVLQSLPFIVWSKNTRRQEKLPSTGRKSKIETYSRVSLGSNKNEVASKNKTFKLVEARELLEQAIQNVTSDKWKSCIKHIIKQETKMSQLDGIMDNVIEPFIISLGTDSTTSESDD
ncbi:hypothetical protein CBL_09966 [Carabus blaptoides fortunei]